MKIKLTSVCVDDQDKALKFYTEKLGFQLKHNIPMGEYKWLTVTSPEGHDDVELVLEPKAHRASAEYFATLFNDGIPATAFESDDLQAEYERLVQQGVEFKSPPKDAGGTLVAMFNDTCGNWIQIYQPSA